jgi:hypothetical protein
MRVQASGYFSSQQIQLLTKDFAQKANELRKSNLQQTEVLLQLSALEGTKIEGELGIYY